MKPKLNIPKRSIKSNQVIKNFRKIGIEISDLEAEEYLDLLYFLAKLVVKQNFLFPKREQKSASKLGYTSLKNTKAESR
ncbi:hypothetical protein ACFQZX_07190 [Mucilaginibacter litoreus]|uniref:Uncharacterized protein n=1 Tax=Mucilaginibacter litoreus TaxID=1048221 RepID=A0ABW3AQT3_9SPHI